MMLHRGGYLRRYAGVDVMAGAGVNEDSTGGPRCRRRGPDAAWAGRGVGRTRGGTSADQAVTIVGLADDGHHLVWVVGDADQGELGRADVRPGEHRLLQPGQQAGPVLLADQDDRELGDLAGGDQGQRLEQLVHGAEPAGQHHERLRVLDEDRLAHEEVAELQADVDVFVQPHLTVQRDARAHRDPAGLGSALVGRLHDPRTAAGDHGVARAGQAGRGALGDVVVVAAPRGPRRAEDRDRGTELGQQAEPLHELGLDPQHPPRVGVHPVGRTAPVEQPLIGRCLRYVLAPQRGGSLAADPPVRLGISVHRVTKVVIPAGYSAQPRPGLAGAEPAAGQASTPWSRRMAFSLDLSCRSPSGRRLSTSRHGRPNSPPGNLRGIVPPTLTDQAGASPRGSSSPVSTSMTCVVGVRMAPAPSMAPRRTRAPPTTMHRDPTIASSSTTTGTALGGSSTPPIPAPPEMWTFLPIWAAEPTVAQVSTIVPVST